MKSKYIFYISAIFFVILISVLYFVEIPSPSIKIDEEYLLEIK